MTTKANPHSKSNVEINLDECTLQTLDTLKRIMNSSFPGMPDISNQALVADAVTSYVADHPEEFVQRPVAISLPILAACKLEKCAALLQMTAREFIEYQCDLFLEASTGHFRMSVQNQTELPEDQKWLAARRVQQFEREHGIKPVAVHIDGRTYPDEGGAK